MAIVAGIVLVATSPDATSALVNVVWVGAVVAYLVYLALSSRRRHPDDSDGTGKD